MSRTHAYELYLCLPVLSDCVALRYPQPHTMLIGRMDWGDAEDYLFKVKSKAKLYSLLYKPRQLKGGVTMVKLSNVCA